MGVGIAQGFATIGGIGFPGRIDYGAIGTVTNLAARLCGEAQAARSSSRSASRHRSTRGRDRARGASSAERLPPAVPAFRVVDAAE
jgi:class 3 adenylate cyclase